MFGILVAIAIIVAIMGVLIWNDIRKPKYEPPFHRKPLKLPPPPVSYSRPLYSERRPSRKTRTVDSSATVVREEPDVDLVTPLVAGLVGYEIGRSSVVDSDVGVPSFDGSGGSSGGAGASGDWDSGSSSSDSGSSSSDSSGGSFGC